MQGVEFSADLSERVFIQDSTRKLGGPFSKEKKRQDCIIINPPYGKIIISSEIYKIQTSLREETTNLYAAFLSLA